MGDDQTNEEIEALVLEINSLRDQLLQSQNDLTELQQANAELAQNTLNG